MGFGLHITNKEEIVKTIYWEIYKKVKYENKREVYLRKEDNYVEILENINIKELEEDKDLIRDPNIKSYIYKDKYIIVRKIKIPRELLKDENDYKLRLFLYEKVWRSI